MERLKMRLKEISGGRVLDVGTRSGEFITTLKEGLKEYLEIVGIDNDNKVIEAAKKKFSDENIQFEQMDGENLSFADDSFDMVCISNTLHHLPDMKIVLEEMKRVLKPGGLFIINEMFCDNQNDAQITHVYLHDLESQVDTLLGQVHGKTYKKQEIINVAANIGLNNIENLEFLETEAMNEKLKSKIEGIDKILEKVNGLPEYEEVKQRGEEIKVRYAKMGIARCTQLIIMGRK